ncbi:DBF4-type zinc finger-containing protein 2 [Clarias gariepinus]|uniref:DBF4-type zinc finger-containing protein 2 n=1 Tax=Clarias gariepinus TaxID=13013 RepID=UPI00234CC09E|nr:DBF4-type zinc finger-containing protein 2 [Clarias gariepinus]
MPLEEGPAPTAENADREESNMANRPSSREEQPVAGPSNPSQRQGFCSYCQVIYNSVEQHIQSARHREVVVRPARTNVPTGSLLERFLQDVFHHHPHGYHDTRSTHADLPCLSTLPVPREELSDVYCRSEDDGLSVGTREEILSSDEEPCPVMQAQPITMCSIGQKQASPSVVMPLGTVIEESAQTVPKTEIIKGEPQLPERYSPTQGYLHRTSCESDLKQQTSKLLAHSLTSQIQHSEQPCSSRPPGSPLFQHKKAHRKTNKHREDHDSSPGTYTSPVTKCITSKAQHGQSELVQTAVLPLWKGPHREQTLSDESDQIHEVIEEVIERHCYSRIPKPNQEEESVFHLSVKSTESKDSEEWDNTFQTALQKNTPEDNRLARLTQVHINLQDQGYKAQLDTALNTVFETEKIESGETKENEAEEIIPDLPHIPPSFVGKTWAQVRYEDDVKIDCLVREFREGRFRCYFDSESVANFERHHTKDKKRRNQEETVGDFQCDDVLPLIEHHEESSKHLPVFRKTRHRIYRMASRCQVVKVSHGTQTAPLKYPIVQRRTVPESDTLLSICETKKDPSPERTPDMKTRMCALKLPASYCKIMTPLQPKTLVYVLSSPDSGQVSFKPTPVKRVGRKRKSSDEECTLKYKYKKTPLKYYDPLTNRILKAPPRGMPSTPSTRSRSHVRQLFRSLSPDINKELYGSAQGRSPRGSRKGRGEGSMADLCASTSGSWLDSGGPSEPGSSVSSRKALFSRSSISSSSRFHLDQIRSSASHTGSSSRANTDSSLKGQGTKIKVDHEQAHIDQPPRRRKQGQKIPEKPLTPAKKPSSPPYRTRRKSTKAKVKPRNVLQRKASANVVTGCRTSMRNKSSTRGSPRS